MGYRTVSLISVVAATVLVTACDRNQADDTAKAHNDAREESARIQGEADQKIAEARREADEKIAAAEKQAQEKKAEARQDVAEARREVAEERRELQEAIKTARQGTKEEYLDYAKNRARLLELQAAELKARAAEVPPAARSEFDNTLAKLEAGRRSVMSSLDEIGKDSKEAWGSAKAKIDKELNDLEKRVGTIDATNPKTTDTNPKTTNTNPKTTDTTNPKSTTPAR